MTNHTDSEPALGYGKYKCRLNILLEDDYYLKRRVIISEESAGDLVCYYINEDGDLTLPTWFDATHMVEKNTELEKMLNAENSPIKNAIKDWLKRGCNNQRYMIE